MSSRLVTGVFAGLLLAGSAVWAAARGETAAPRREPGKGAPVLVELFSSEGCSSCPPADEYVRELDEGQPVSGATVVALEFHVDYWNDLGWTDPFSSPEFSERQREYGRRLNEPRIFTPEMIVHGTYIANGDRVSTAQRIAAAALEPHANVALARSGDVVDVHVENAPATPGDRREVWLAVTESGLVSRVTSGENRGRLLSHAPVVRRLVRLGLIEETSFASRVTIPVAPEWNAKRLRYVAFVQAGGSRRIVGVGFSGGRT